MRCAILSHPTLLLFRLFITAKAPSCFSSFLESQMCPGEGRQNNPSRKPETIIRFTMFTICAAKYLSSSSFTKTTRKLTITFMSSGNENKRHRNSLSLLNTLLSILYSASTITTRTSKTMSQYGCIVDAIPFFSPRAKFASFSKDGLLVEMGRLRCYQHLDIQLSCCRLNAITFLVLTTW